MRYDATSGCYTGEWLAVPECVFQQALEARVAAGERPDAVLEDLLDELSWSLETPGVVLARRSGTLRARLRAGEPLPWPLRFRVPVLHSDESRAAALRRALEAAGMRAPTIIVDDTASIDRLCAALTPAPLLCVFGAGGALAQAWRSLHAQLPGCRFVLTTPPHEQGGPLPAGVHSLWQPAEAEEPAYVARAALNLFMRTLPEQASLGVRMALAIERACLLSGVAGERYIHALAFRGQARSLRTQDRRVRAQAIMLREQARMLRGGATA
ncbi:MAG TPA: hypothetical protein VFA70_04960 [Dehalococcoidia bacterium]|jgi:hypothetical protein|nr:hypothetical protein [Dehalococcoidia bacterium]